MIDSTRTTDPRQQTGRRSGRLHEVRVEIEIPFHDVDAIQVVWHGHYYKYFEIARTALLRSRGLDARDLMRHQMGLLVIETRCRHTSPLRYGDRAEVAAWFRDLDYRIMVDYEIINLTSGRRAAKGHTALVATAPDGTMHYRTPDTMLSLLAPDSRKEDSRP
ncbi:MAG: acyl-CoA thioesterase [bacterium]|nr:acyl-CoA thioesterase [bacterium]